MTEPQESVTDAWYVDLNQRLSCDRNWAAGKTAHATPPSRSMADTQERRLNSSLLVNRKPASLCIL